MSKKRITNAEIALALENLSSDEEDINIEHFSDSESEYVLSASEIDDELSETETEIILCQNDQGMSFKGKDGTIWERSHPPSSKIRNCNIVKGKIDKIVLPPGNKLYFDKKKNNNNNYKQSNLGKTLVSVLDCFRLFISNEVCEIIVKHTNEEAEREYTKQSKKWTPVDNEELLGFFGLLMTAGHMKSNNQNYRLFWDRLYGITIFKATMSGRRFEELLRFIRFDDKSTRSSRRANDKLAPVRNIWDMVTNSFGKYYMPSENLVVDEQLMPCRSRCSFIQYLPSKPDKYGIKIFWLCDSKNAYPLRGIPYTGKEGRNKAVGLAKTIVENLCEPYFGTNRNITMDNYFTSKDLAESLLAKGLTIVGTIRKNKACIPPEFLPNRRREVSSTIFGFQKNISIASHVPKVGKAVIFMSTMHHSPDILEVNGKKISEINSFYNKTKGGVDTLDQLIHEYMTKRKTNRWPFSFFMNILDAAGIAAYILWTKTNPHWNTGMSNKRHLFLRELCELMVEPLILQRQTQKYVRMETKTAIATVLNNQGKEPLSEVNTNKRKRCHICPAKKSKMQKQCCDICNKNVCNEHSTTTKICINCSK